MVREFRPNSANELKEIVAGALADETPLRVLGAGSKESFGRPLLFKGSDFARTDLPVA